jgi:hypothetical protein
MNSRACPGCGSRIGRPEESAPKLLIPSVNARRSLCRERTVFLGDGIADRFAVAEDPLPLPKTSNRPRSPRRTPAGPGLLDPGAPRRCAPQPRRRQDSIIRRRLSRSARPLRRWRASLRHCAAGFARALPRRSALRRAPSWSSRSRTRCRRCRTRCAPRRTA